MSQVYDILVIDDESTVTQAVAKICGAEGMSVLTAGQASEALKYVENNVFQLMLCDIMMPELNGFQFLEELVRRGITTPVIMMTGYSTVENAVKSLTSTGAVIDFGGGDVLEITGTFTLAQLEADITFI